MVDHLHRRRRVVDGGRQRPDRDVDEDPKREGRVLVDRPLDPERANLPASRRSASGGSGETACTSSRTAREETKFPTACRITMTASLLTAQASRPSLSTA
jgi:hypothetical protein